MAVLTLLLGATAAVSQTTMPQQRPAPPAPSRTEVPKAPVAGQIVVQDANTVLAKELIGQTVYASDKAKIGSISDLILSKDAKTVEGFVIGVGGFLGIGEKSVAIDMGAFQVVPASTGSSAGAGGAMLISPECIGFGAGSVASSRVPTTS